MLTTLKDMGAWMLATQTNHDYWQNPQMPIRAHAP